MATLTEGDVSASAVGGIVGGMTVIGGHGMPKRTPCRTETEIVSDSPAKKKGDIV